MTGRDEQLNRLEEFYSSGNNNMTILYGRHRIGKTALLKEFLAGKQSVVYAGMQAVSREQINNFNRAADNQLDNYMYHESYDDIFAEILHNAVGVKVIVIEEFQNIVKADSEFMESVTRLVNGEISDSRVMIILTCSSVSWIENSMVGAIGKSAYSINALMKLKELTYAESVNLFPEAETDTLLCIYAVTGGIPGYMSQWNQNESIKENICRLFLRENSIFADETELFLKDEFREIGVYNTILQCLADNKNKLNEIHNYTGFGRDKISVYLKNLTERDIVEKVFSYETGSNEHTKKGLYRIKDAYIDFWYRFIYRHYSMLEITGAEEFYSRYIEPGFNDFLIEAFKQIAGEFMEILGSMEQLPFKAERKGSWHGKVGDIHLIFEDENGNAIIGQVFTQNSPVGIDAFEKIKSNAQLAHIKVRCFYLFSTEGFTSELLKLQDESIVLVRIEDL